MERQTFAAFCIILHLLLCFPQSLSPQTTTSGELTCVVTDPSGAVVPDVAIELKQISKGTSQQAKTGKDGTFLFFFLAPDVYNLTIAHMDFPAEHLTVTVRLGPPERVNVSLRL